MKKQKFIVDRIEKNYVILQDYNDRIIQKDINSFYTKPNEGDIVIIDENNLFKLSIKETKKRKKEINTLMKGMWK